VLLKAFLQDGQIRWAVFVVVLCSSVKATVMRVCREYGWGLSALEEGQMGVAFAFLTMVWRVFDVLDVGVIEGTQKDGKVVFAAYEDG